MYDSLLRSCNIIIATNLVDISVNGREVLNKATVSVHAMKTQRYSSAHS